MIGAPKVGPTSEPPNEHLIGTTEANKCWDQDGLS